MANELAFDLLYGVGNENEVFELSYATFAEELQLQEILEASMLASEITTTEPSTISSSLPLPSRTSTPEAISSPGSESSLELEAIEKDCIKIICPEKDKNDANSVISPAFNFKTEKERDAFSEAIQKSERPICHNLSCTECTIPQVSGLNCHKQQSIDLDEIVEEAQSSGLGCNEQRRINRDEKRIEHFMVRKPIWRRSMRHSQSKFNGRRIGDIPETSSSKFHAKMSSRGEDVLIVGADNTQDPKGKGVAIDDDWVLVSQRNPYSGNRYAKRWDLEHPSPLTGSKDSNRNVVHEDDYDSLDDEDDSDSDTSQKSHESPKKSKWFKEFFERLDALNITEIDETVWHCPACQRGPGAIKWYRSIQDLIAHAKSIGARRVKLHRELAELLEGKLQGKGTSIAPAGQVLSNWKGLKEDAIDHEIVWPPMVVIMNTMTCIYKDGKCIGMGSQELLELFSSYPALKAQHSYGPHGHRGRSVLIFESSATGYLEAERLHKNFVKQGFDRFAWNSSRDGVLPGGERQLYGFMAVKEDLDIFNHHCQDKLKIKYELKSYQEAVLNEIKKMDEDNQQLIWLKDRLDKERRCAKTFDGSIDNLSRNLQQKIKDIRIFKRRVQLLHEQNEEEMESQENFYKDQFRILEARVKELEKLLESNGNPVHTGEPAPAVARLTEECTPYQY